ncbi:TPA: hypothetical protein P2N04_003992 [Aeromonas salmonicida]|uniref:hypothetical protein n=1 Tax=Aeromonas veronii TaxID=654 RepID=UPI00147FCB9D|nr:hypothetical protein [Aeromonas veronii]HDN9770045.1 hypothetical protein [Aeromonas salmonicida]HDN9792610.1 hypothetical protein [Aeromonas salmonicida]HDN9801698.1 hypothetical protein [Aeromonas salmonicida]HDN9815447.1 hypothetical protein [Aeromonas salmonicida]HDO0296698.1 hypothetical protein [Aeromonas salmonicida]
MAGAAFDTRLPVKPAHQLLESITAPAFNGAELEGAAPMCQYQSLIRAKASVLWIG